MSDLALDQKPKTIGREKEQNVSINMANQPLHDLVCVIVTRLINALVN